MHKSETVKSLLRDRAILHMSITASCAFLAKRLNVLSLSSFAKAAKYLYSSVYARLLTVLDAFAITLATNLSLSRLRRLSSLLAV